jgi:hypothetical protein
MKRVVPFDDEYLVEHYSDLIELSKIFNHPIIEDDDGRYRWAADPLMKHVVGLGLTKHNRECAQRSSYYRENFGERIDWDTKINYFIDLNELAIDFQRGKFPLESYMKFQMAHGYSLAGFVEVFYQGAIDSVIEKHKGKGNWMLNCEDCKELTETYREEKYGFLDDEEFGEDD